MKNVKRAILGIGILSAGFIKRTKCRNDKHAKNWRNVGIAAPSTNASANLGIDVAYQHLVTPGFGLGIATVITISSGKITMGSKIMILE